MVYSTNFPKWMMMMTVFCGNKMHPLTLKEEHK